MPELVEVETTRRDLRQKIVGKEIQSVNVLLDKIVYDKKNEFINDTTDQLVKDVKRRGKWLLIELPFKYIVIHFRMEGRFYLLPRDAIIEKHDYVIFMFDSFSLHYNDPRQFGNMRIISKDKLKEFFDNKKLGLEYDDITLTGKGKYY